MKKSHRHKIWHATCASIATAALALTGITPALSTPAQNSIVAAQQTSYQTKGAIGSAWQNLGSASSWLGQPVSNEISGLRDGGVVQHFQGGSVYWTTGTGAKAVKKSSGIQSAWEYRGGLNGEYAYPVTHEIAGLVNGGVWQGFQGGTIHWSPNSGAHATKGAVLSKWREEGSESGWLGYPTSSEVKVKNGVYQDFQGGKIYWSAATGAKSTKISGRVYTKWKSLNWENGWLGYPTSDQLSGLRNNGYWQSFQGGVIMNSPYTFAHTVKGTILNRWRAEGSENGWLGYPTTEELAVSDGVIQQFENGYIRWYSRTNTTTAQRHEGQGSTESAQAIAQDIFRFTNSERTKAGLSPLTWNSSLATKANNWAYHMGSTGVFEHNPNGGAENIVHTQWKATPRQLIDLWLDSSGHRKVMLRETRAQIGVGVYITPDGHVYAVQNFL